MALSPRSLWSPVKSRLNTILGRSFSSLLLLALWQIASSEDWISARVLAGPVKVAETFWGLLLSGELGSNLLVSLERAMTGLAIALVLGTSLALLAGLSRLGEKIIDMPVQMLRALPFLGLVPLFILWFGIGETPKIALVAMGATFPIYINLFAGIRDVDVKLIEATSAFGLTPAERILHVVLPGALPFFLVGLRYAFGFSWLSLVVAEQINATSGIGYLVMQAREYLRTDVMLVGLTVYALLGYSSHVLVQQLERRALAWRPSLLR